MWRGWYFLWGGFSGCGAVVGYSGGVHRCPVVGMLISFFMVKPLRLLPMVVMGFWRGFVMSSFGGERGVGVGVHNTIGCIMSVWCGIMFMWG